MSSRRMRPLHVVAALAAVAALASGCASPAPDPTPTGFASEAEAFAAAEETYRAYVDALNDVDLADPETFEAVYQWTTGELNASDREGLSRYHAEGFTVSGESQITLLDGQRAASTGEIVLSACLDVSEVTLRNAEGASQTQPDRVPIQSLEVHAQVDDDAEVRLRLIAGRQGPPEC